jgi:hypothetical protein
MEFVVFVSGMKAVYKASRTRNLVVKLSSFLILVLDYHVPFHPLARHSSLMSPQADTEIIYFFWGAAAQLGPGHLHSRGF